MQKSVYRVRTHHAIEARLTPHVARHKGCDRCSLLDLCLPGVTGTPAHPAGDPMSLARYVELPEDTP